MGRAFFDIVLRQENDIRGVIAGETIEGRIDAYFSVRVAAPEDSLASEIEADFHNLEASVPELIRYEPEVFIAERLKTVPDEARRVFYEEMEIVDCVNEEVVNVDEAA